MKNFIKIIVSKLKCEQLDKKPFLLKCLIVFFSGAVCSLSQAPYSLWWLFYIAFPIFYLTFKTSKSAKTAALFGWLFGFGYFTFGLNWIGNALLVDDNEFWWVWPLSVIALPMALSAFTGTATLAAFLLNKNKKIPLFLITCIGLSLSEYARGNFFTGFPWNLYGYIWSNELPLLQSLSIVGPYGLTFLTLLWATIPISLIDKSEYNKKLTVISTLSIISALTFGIIQLQKPVLYNDDVQLQIVQPNIKQKDKWNNSKLAINLNKHIYLSKRQEDAAPIKTVIIWPETSLGPVFLDSKAALELINNVLEQHPKGSLLLAGAAVYNFNENNEVSNYNTVSVLDGKSKPINIYAKTHLVPFGEYIPFKKYIPIKAVSGFTGFVKGKGAQVFSPPGIPSFTPMICYEVIFPDEITPFNNRPEWLLNVTNDAWYGKSAGPYQHFAQTRFRAIEQGLPLARSANTGISGLIDPFGRVIASHGLMTHGLIISKLPKPLPATLYSKFRDIPFLIFMALLSIFLFYRKKNKI